MSFLFRSVSASFRSRPVPGTSSTRTRSWVPIVTAVAATFILTAPRVSTQSPGRRSIEILHGKELVAGEALVRLKAGARATGLSTPDVDLNRPLANGLRHVRSRGRNTAALIAALAARADVAYVEPNYVVRASAVPNDPYFNLESGLLNSSQPGADSHATSAWDLTTGGTANVVALVDSGVDYHHVDLALNIWTAPASFTVTIGGTSITCPAGSHGFNALAMTCDPMDDYGHGTAMAGVIGAGGNNAVGVVGMNWKTSIMPVKFLGSDGSGSYADAIDAIEFAIQARNAFAASGGANVRILSNSWSGSGFSQALLDEINRAATYNMLFVASAGNDSSDNDAVAEYPSSYTAANVVSVAATTTSDTLQSFSNYGATSVDLGAPSNAYSTAMGNGYAWTDGTSPAAALVSGAAALTLSACTLSTTDLKQTILTSVDALTSLDGRTVTGGRLDVARAIRMCRGLNAPPSVHVTAPADGTQVQWPTSLTVTADAADEDGTVASVDFYAGSTLIGRDTSAPFAVNWSAPPGTYDITAVATDNAGATARSSEQVLVSVVQPPPSLPSGWQTQDIGNTGVAGSASYSAPTFTVAGAGADVWGASDQFRFVYQTLSGDGEIIARVTAIEDVSSWTKAGVMIRETLAANAPHAFMMVTPGKGLAFQRRTVAGGLTTNTSGGAGTAPHWARLRRSGQTITAAVSGDGASWTTVGQDTFSMASTVYVGFAVSSHDSTRLATASFGSTAVHASSTAPASGSLPSGWSDRDIGAVGVQGGASVASGTISVAGAGADVWGAADAFHFAYRTLTGDGQITARVSSVGNVAAWTKAGVMIRATLDAGSAHAFMLVSAGKGLAFQRRLTTGGTTTSTTSVAGASPVWVRLVRAGQTITASLSGDGVHWTTVGQDTFSMPSTVYVGLAVSSHDATRTATAAFDTVTAGAGASLPAGWMAQDVGSVGAAGWSADSGGTFTVKGAGADVWGSADAFRFAYTTLPGDGQIVARVATLDNITAWTKAGVMMRESADAGSAHAFMLVSAGKGLAFQRRTATGGLSTSTSGGSSTAPYWVKLARSGQTITASVSSDGNTWRVVGQETFSMASTIDVGLAVSSHDVTRAAAGAFTNVVITR